MNKRSGTNSRQNITRAAIKVFGEKGYKQTTMREVAQKAGMSVGAIYLYFKNKERLYLELMAEEAADLQQRLERLRNEEPCAALHAYIRSNIDFAEKKRKLVNLNLKEHDLKFMAPMRKVFFDTQKKLVEDILTAGKEKGVFRVEDLENTALLILFAIRGTVVSHFGKQIGNLGTSGTMLGDTLLSYIRNGDDDAV